MSVSFPAPVYWDAFIDEYGGIWKVATEEGVFEGENEFLIRQRLNRAVNMVINNPENYEKYKGKTYSYFLINNYLDEIRQLLGYQNPRGVIGILKYG